MCVSPCDGGYRNCFNFSERKTCETKCSHDNGGNILFFLFLGSCARDTRPLLRIK